MIDPINSYQKTENEYIINYFIISNYFISHIMSHPTITDNYVATEIAKRLLQVEAVKLQPENPFTWASGWKSPIYCDNRITLSHPEVRNYIKTELVALIQRAFPNVTAVSGVATGAIAQGALVADLLGLPFTYIRSKAKDHGMGNQIEGRIESGARVVVVEDLISTGGSSLNAVEALRSMGVEVLGMVAIYTHGFPQATKSFEDANVTLYTLSDYDAVMKVASEINYISEAQCSVLAEWRKDPANWNISK